MDVREKLVELVDDYTNHLTVRDIHKADFSEKFFDHLISHDVTVQGWVSVKDRLPGRNDIVIAFYPTMRGTIGEIQIHKAWAMSETCTHWMPLPQPPKGE